MKLTLSTRLILSTCKAKGIDNELQCEKSSNHNGAIVGDYDGEALGLWHCNSRTFVYAAVCECGATNRSTGDHYDAPHRDTKNSLSGRENGAMMMRRD
ncbi:hypothetical protein BCEP4_260019 [Burkholderia cepacia]|nr:hypothetical protein BCEP4_260019 [Burkholderia cepacia]